MSTTTEPSPFDTGPHVLMAFPSDDESGAIPGDRYPSHVFGPFDGKVEAERVLKVLHAYSDQEFVIERLETPSVRIDAEGLVVNRGT